MMLCIVNQMNDCLWNSLYCMYMAFTVLYVYGFVHSTSAGLAFTLLAITAFYFYHE